jgi:hypothetical protein
LPTRLLADSFIPKQMHKLSDKRRVRPQDIVKRLLGLGFCEVFHLSPELIQAQYFPGSDKLIAPHFEQIIAARV